jgi:hypothetical protein
MNYLLTTSTGEKMTFYLLECAEIFRQAFGGTITLLEQENNVEEVAVNNLSNK